MDDEYNTRERRQDHMMVAAMIAGGITANPDTTIARLKENPGQVADIALEIASQLITKLDKLHPRK